MNRSYEMKVKIIQINHLFGIKKNPARGAFLPLAGAFTAGEPGCKPGISFTGTSRRLVPPKGPGRTPQSPLRETLREIKYFMDRRESFGDSPACPARVKRGRGDLAILVACGCNSCTVVWLEPDNRILCGGTWLLTLAWIFVFPLSKR